MVMRLVQLDGKCVAEYGVLQVNGYNRPVLVEDKDGNKICVVLVKADGKTLEDLNE